jgi:hypothetical protein
MKLSFLKKKENVSMTPVTHWEMPEYTLLLKTKRQHPTKEQAKNKKELKHGN